MNARVPDSNAFDEMICDSCTTKNDFLNYYSGYCITPTDDANIMVNTSTELNDIDNDVANTSTAKVTEATTVIETEMVTKTATETKAETIKEISIDTINEKAVPDTATVPAPASTPETTEISPESETANATEAVTEQKLFENENGLSESEKRLEKGLSISETGSPETKKVETEKKDAILKAEIKQCIQNIFEINKNIVQSSNSPSKRRQSVTNDDIPSNPSKKMKCDEMVASSSSDVCRKPTIALSKFTGASFWQIEWRTKLCKCTKCLNMYKMNDVEFLLDDEDTVHAYQEKGKAKAESRTTTVQDETMRALSGMDHVTQIEAVLAYNKLKKKLTEFLSTFVSNEQVVTAKDVDSFFGTMGKKE